MTYQPHQSEDKPLATTIDLTPPWSVVAIMTLALLKDGKGQGLYVEIARAMALAQALKEVRQTLAPEVQATLGAVYTRELNRIRADHPDLDWAYAYEEPK